MKKKKNVWFGPSTLVAAAFIGPGTVTICSKAGSSAGYSLIWALIFSIIATLVLQEMTARLGIVTGEGLAEAIRKHSGKGLQRIAFICIAFAAIVIGNAAYEAGNLSGAVLGLETIGLEGTISAVLLMVLAGIFLWFGKYKIIERLLVGLVLLMSLCFMLSLCLVEIDWVGLLSGFLPSIPNGTDLLLIMGLVGTTVVPYNLFMHASIINKKWKNAEDLPLARKENMIAICLGGFVSISIMITAASALFGSGKTLQNAADLAIQLEPLLGEYAKWGLSIGLFAAGLSSAVTAPLAAALTAKGLFNWSEKSWQYRVVWMAILVLGLSFFLSGYKPILIIQFAQVANGILLPMIAIFLWYIMNQSSILGKYVNNTMQNVMSFIIIAVCILIACRSLYLVFLS